MAVVFTDSFVIAADDDISFYPSGSPNYAYSHGSPGQIAVSSAANRAFPFYSPDDTAARIINAAVPTGDQWIYGTISFGSYRRGALLVRAGSEKHYIADIDATQANECRIRRRDNSTTTTVLASADRGFSTAVQAVSLSFKATGTGATVTLDAQWAATAVLSFADTSANRIVSGTPGIGGYSDQSASEYIDDITVETLTAAAKAFPPYRRPLRFIRRGR